MKKLLLFSLPLLSAVPSCLKEPCPTCDRISVSLSHPGDSLTIDSVVFLGQGIRARQNVEPSTDSLSYAEVRLDNPNSISPFVFYYPQRASDTLVLRHRFEKRYGQDCEDYYYELLNLSVARTTFPEWNLEQLDEPYYRSAICNQLEVSL